MEKKLNYAMAKQKQRFSLRKLSVGVTSVMLGTVFFLQGGRKLMLLQVAM